MRTDLVWPVDGSTPDEQLKLEKVAVSVDLLFDGGERLRGETYLLPVVETVSRKERVIDLVRSPERFLPLATGGEMRLVNKTHIVLIRVTDPDDAGFDEPTEAFGHDERVSLELGGVPETDRFMDVKIAWNAPAHCCRLLDHLNDAGEWIAVEDGSGLGLVATRYVVAVKPLTDGPA